MKPTASTSDAQSERGAALIKQLVTGGLEVGGGVGLGVALANLVSSLQKEKEIYDPSELNSETLYVPVKGEKERTKEASGPLPWLGPGIALAGGATSALLGYSAVQQLWSKIQKARRKKILDEAQNEALVSADMEAAMNKASSDAKLNMSDSILGVPVATALLAALATGGVTMSALNKAFPTITKTKSVRPKRVRIVGEDGVEQPLEVDEDSNIKEASLGDFEAAGREFTAGLVSRLRPDGMTRAMLNLVAHRGVNGLRGTVKSAGVAALPDALKGWGEKDVTARDMMLASMALHKNAYMSEVAHAVAVQELMDAIPNVVANAVGDGDPHRMKKAADIASILGLAARRQYLPEFASADAPATNASPYDFQTALESASGAKEEADAGLNSDAGGTLSNTENDSDKQEEVGDDDHVDSLMTGSAKMSVG